MELIQRANWGDLDGVKTLIQQGVCVNAKNHCNQTAVYLACEKGHADVVQYLLDSGASVNLGAKSLIAAVRNNHYECCKLLLQHYATVNCTNTKRESPMSIAVQKHYYSIILLLLEYGAIPSSLLSDVVLELLKHAKVQHAKVVQKLVDQNIINLALENIFLAAVGFAFRCGSVELIERMLSNDSYSTLDQLYPDAAYYSAKNNWPAVLSRLVNGGVNVNTLTDGQTPLYVACKEGHKTIVMLLLNSGANPNIKNEYHATASKLFPFPLQTAVQQGNAEICNLLLQNGAKLNLPGEPLLPIACSAARDEWKTDEAAETRSDDQMLSTVRLLLQQEVNVNAVSDEGDTALYRACRSHQLEVVRVLLEAGADVNLTSDRRYPLMAACSDGSVELISLLVCAGADAKCSNSSNETCLHVLIDAYLSILNSRTPAVGDPTVNIVNVIKSLLEAGADINARSSQEETALYRASRAGHGDIVRLLLDAGAETDGMSSCRPLYAACECGYAEIVDLLLQHGADTNGSSVSRSPTVAEERADRVTDSSSLPVCCAAQKGYTKIIELLLKYGADVNKKDQLGKSALVYIVELLTLRWSRSPQISCPSSEERNILISVLSADVTVPSGYDGVSPLHIASSAGMCDIMLELIQHGANCNQLTYNEISAVDLACKNGHEAALELLLKNGANPDGGTGCTCSTRSVHDSCKSHSMPPVCMAVKNNSKTMVEMLLKCGANVNASNEKGDTALHLATSTTIIKTLLNAKANVNAMNDDGETALSIVCEKRQADISVVELLLKFGADPNISFPLYAAYKSNNTDIVKMLLAYGAEANKPLKKSKRSCLKKGIIESSFLCIACTDGNVDVVDCLLKHGADAAFADSNEDTVLHYAIERHGRQENSEEYDPIVTLLLQRHVPVNAVNSEGETPLYVACRNGLAGVTKQLLDCKASISLTTNNSNKYPLVIACEKRHRNIAVMLLDQGANANVDKYSQTPLKLASANGDVELVRQLIHYGADVNQMQNVSDTALHVAVVRCTGVGSKAFVDVVRTLLISGAGPNAVNDKYETPMYLACSPPDDDANLDLVQALLEYGADPNVYPLSQLSYCGIDYSLPPLFAACRGGNTALVILLLKYGAVVNHRTEFGRTALHYAIGCDNDGITSCSESTKSSVSTAKMLLSSGANVNVMDRTGASPLYLACDRGKTELVKLLLSHGANPNVIAAERPKHPVHAACTGHNYDSLKLLLEYNADVSVRDECDRTALHCVLESAAHRISNGANKNVLFLVQLLLDRGADVNVASKDGETPLYMACFKGLTSVVATLLEYGAKMDGTSGIKLPLNVACRQNDVSVVRLLLNSGANPDIPEAGLNRYHRVLPLHIAAVDGTCEVVELLLKYVSNIDITDACGSTALHYAVKYLPSANPVETAVDVLLENGADVNILNRSGETPLYIAVSRGLLDVVGKMLQSYGGNPNTPSPEDKNPLVTACEKCNVELVDMLLKNGADPNPVSVCCSPYYECKLPLCTAVAEGINNDDIVVLLVKAGANVNAINGEGKTALCIATESVTNGYHYMFTDKMKFSTVRLLLEHGADLNVLMPDGQSMLCFVVVCASAVSRRHEYQAYFIELLQLLVQHRAILSDSFNILRQDISCCLSVRVLKDLAMFDGKHTCKLIVDLFKAGAGFQLIALCCNVIATLPGEGRSTHLCQAAILAGYTPSAEELLDLQLAAVSEDEDGILDQLVDWLSEDGQQVPCLLRQCRVVIRRQLSVAVRQRSILPAINKLPLPNSMKMYLQFEGPLTEVDISIKTDLCIEGSSTEYRHQSVFPDGSEYGGCDSLHVEDDIYDYHGDYW